MKTEKEACTVMIPLRVTPTTAAAIDELRGEWSRTEWCRRAMARSTANLYRGQVLLVPRLTGPPRDEDAHPINVMTKKQEEKR